MKETYKGYNIEYIEDREIFRADIGDNDYENKSLSKVKKYIDNLEKKDFKRVDVIVENWGRYEFGVVTSCVESENYRGEIGIDCWVNLKEGIRTKQDIKKVYLDNALNRTILTEIAGHEQTIEDIKREIKELQSSFEGYKQEK